MNVAVAPSKVITLVGSPVITGGLTTFSVNTRFCATPSPALVNSTVPVYVPTVRLLATLFRLTATVAVPWASSVPDVLLTSSQEASFASDQLIGLLPAFVKTRFCEVTVKGPPAPPAEVKPVPGKINSSS